MDNPDEKDKNLEKQPSSYFVQHDNASPALTFKLICQSGRARRSMLYLPHGVVHTPVFMAVGTHGTVKGVTNKDLQDIGYQIILGNTYHLGNQPGAAVLKKFNGLHNFMLWNKNLLTDSGGFQMVSLLRLAEVTEAGVSFRSPVDKSLQLLTPEASIELQNCIGADIIMALDDVVSAVLPDKARVAIAAQRTTRWLDRCIAAHQRPTEQNLFGIVQGGLYEDLRLQSIKELKERNLPGYAIGGLSGGEEKDTFWRIVNLCTSPDGDRGLPRMKPRYLMGVGHPLDIVVCVALGVDMFDCVYPARTARFGTALVPEGVLRVKHAKYSTDTRPLQMGCRCMVCKHYTRADLHHSFSRDSIVPRLLTLHNLTYMFDLCASMRDAIETNTFADFVISFLARQYHTNLKEKYKDCAACNNQHFNTSPHIKCTEEMDKQPPVWVRGALKAANIDLDHVYCWDDEKPIRSLE